MFNIFKREEKELNFPHAEEAYTRTLLERQKMVRPYLEIILNKINEAIANQRTEIEIATKYVPTEVCKILINEYGYRVLDYNCGFCEISWKHCKDTLKGDNE